MERGWYWQAHTHTTNVRIVVSKALTNTGGTDIPRLALVDLTQTLVLTAGLELCSALGANTPAGKDSSHT